MYASSPSRKYPYCRGFDHCRKSELATLNVKMTSNIDFRNACTDPVPKVDVPDRKSPSCIYKWLPILISSMYASCTDPIFSSKATSNIDFRHVPIVPVPEIPILYRFSIIVANRKEQTYIKAPSNIHFGIYATERRQLVFITSISDMYASNPFWK